MAKRSAPTNTWSERFVSFRGENLSVTEAGRGWERNVAVTRCQSSFHFRAK